MKITHISNSFILVESSGGSVKIACDPWVGIGNYGGWHSYPEFSSKDLYKLMETIDYVYISHLHDDHFDPLFLKNSGLANKKFIIKKFDFPVLANRLKGLGVEEIIEIPSWEKFEIDDMQLSIIPQLSSNSSELDDEVGYDLDTSIVFHDKSSTFFNQVDNPLSKGNLRTVKEFIEKSFGTLTVAALTCGAASEYPQAFLNVDRAKEQSRIIVDSIKSLEGKLDELCPKNFFLAGGTYFAPGPFSTLNQYIALPDHSMVSKALDAGYQKPLNLEGGKTLVLNNGSTSQDIAIIDKIIPCSSSMKKSIEMHSHDTFLYEDDHFTGTKAMLDEIFNLAVDNWKISTKGMSFNNMQNVEFTVYSSMSLNAEGNIDSLDVVNNYELTHPDQSESLKVYIHQNAFYKCLIRQQVWNGTIGGCCLFEREPNIFYPNTTFSLNYLALNKNQISNYA